MSEAPPSYDSISPPASAPSAAASASAGQSVVLRTDSVKQVVFSLQWRQERASSSAAASSASSANFGDDDADLDLSAVLFSADGSFAESIYFGNLLSTLGGGAVAHTGDIRTSSVDGEEIVIHLDKLPSSVHFIFLCVSNYSGQLLQHMQNGRVRAFSSSRNSKAENDLALWPLTAASNRSAFLLCRLRRIGESSFEFLSISAPVDGRSFGDLLPSMQLHLKDVLPSLNIDARPHVVVLAKGESVALSAVSQSKTTPDAIVVGLGWDPLPGSGKAIDLDASVLMFNDKNQLEDLVFFSHLRSNCGSIQHRGDSLTGEGDGDDEAIFCDLSILPKRVTTLFFLVNSYSGHRLSSVQNAYIRIVDDSREKAKYGSEYLRKCSRAERTDANELMRFTLSSPGNSDHTALIMCKLQRKWVGSDDDDKKNSDSGTHSRNSVGWRMTAIGHASQGTMCRDNVPECQRELAGRLKITQMDAKHNGFLFKPYKRKAVQGSNENKSVTGVRTSALECYSAALRTVMMHNKHH